MIIRNQVLLASLWLWQTLLASPAQPIVATITPAITAPTNQESAAIGSIPAANGINLPSLTTTGPFPPMSPNRFGLPNISPNLNPSVMISGVPLSFTSSQRLQPVPFAPVALSPVAKSGLPAPSLNISNNLDADYDYLDVLILANPASLGNNFTQNDSLNVSPNFLDFDYILDEILNSTDSPVTPKTPTTNNINRIQTPSQNEGFELLKRILETMEAQSLANTVPNSLTNKGVPLPEIKAGPIPVNNAVLANTALLDPVINNGVSLSAIKGVPLPANNGVPLPGVLSTLPTGVQITPSVISPVSGDGKLGVLAPSISPLAARSGVPLPSNVPVFSDLGNSGNFGGGIGLLSGHNFASALGGSIIPIPEDVNLGVPLSATNVPNFGGINPEMVKQMLDNRLNNPLGTMVFFIGQPEPEEPTDISAPESLPEPPSIVGKNLISAPVVKPHNPTFEGISSLSTPSIGPIFKRPVSLPLVSPHHSYPSSPYSFPVSSAPYGSPVIHSSPYGSYGDSHYHGSPPLRQYRVRIRRPTKEKSKGMDYYYKAMKDWWNKGDKKESEKIIIIRQQPHYSSYPTSDSYGIPQSYPSTGPYGKPHSYPSSGPYGNSHSYPSSGQYGSPQSYPSSGLYGYPHPYQNPLSGSAVLSSGLHGGPTAGFGFPFGTNSPFFGRLGVPADSLEEAESLELTDGIGSSSVAGGGSGGGIPISLTSSQGSPTSTDLTGGGNGGSGGSGGSGGTGVTLAEVIGGQSGGSGESLRSVGTGVTSAGRGIVDSGHLGGSGSLGVGGIGSLSGHTFASAFGGSIIPHHHHHHHPAHQIHHPVPTHHHHAHYPAPTIPTEHVFVPVEPPKYKRNYYKGYKGYGGHGGSKGSKGYSRPRAVYQASQYAPTYPSPSYQGGHPLTSYRSPSYGSHPYKSQIVHPSIHAHY